MTTPLDRPTGPGQPEDLGVGDAGGARERVLGSVNTWANAINDWQTWMVAQNRSPDTVRQWHWLLRRFAEAHVRQSPWRVSTEQIYTWYTSQGWAPGSVKGARSAIRSFYDWAQVAGRTRRHPARALPPVRVGRNLPRPASEDVIAVALTGATDKTRLMILLGAKAALRCTEIAQLRWADVGPAAMRVHGKGDRERIVDLHPELAAVLRAELARRVAGGHGTGWRYTAGGHVWVFPGKSRGHMAPRYVSQVLSSALGPGATAHMLRHRAAAVALDATHDLAAVQELLGHASPVTTRIYTPVGGAARRAVIDAL